jgi:hypothetical protein
MRSRGRLVERSIGVRGVGLGAASPRTLFSKKRVRVSAWLKPSPDTRPEARAKATAGPSTRPGRPGLAQDDRRLLLLGMTADLGCSGRQPSLSVRMRLRGLGSCDPTSQKRDVGHPRSWLGESCEGRRQRQMQVLRLVPAGRDSLRMTIDFGWSV